MDRTRRILLIIGLIVVVVGVTALIYFFFFKSETPALTPVGPGVSITPGGLPQIGGATGEPTSQTEAGRLQGVVRQPAAGTKPAAIANGALTDIQAVTNNSVVEPQLNSAGQLVYYDKGSNYFYRLTAKGAERLSDQAFYGATKITWSSSGDKAVIYYPDDSKIIYDFNKQQQYSVPKVFSEIQFAKDGDHLAAKQITKDPNQNWLVVFSPDGKIMKGVERLGEYGSRVTVNWSADNQVVAFLQEGRGASGAEIFPVGQNKENFASFMVPGFGFESLWAPSGNTFLFSSSLAENGFRPNLYIGRGLADNPGSSQTDLGLQTTPDKCTFNAVGDVAYCAVPENLPAVSGPFPQLAKGLQHDFYRIDLNSGQIRLLGQPFFTIEGTPQSVDVGRVLISPDESELYFTNQSTGRIYKMRLR
ncbi:MAG: hypothetical protein NTV81_01140 [Candidatus Komeilibacteria bacterium]|nr:hypothetical protein [Candidatus Komeilibacteria bacterium]